MLKRELAARDMSRREIEVVEQVEQGLTNKEAANNLFVTEKTVKFHMTNIFKKLGVKNRQQLIVWCSRKRALHAEVPAGAPSEVTPVPLLGENILVPGRGNA